MSQVGPELAGKRLELLKEAFPKTIGWLSFGHQVLDPPLPSSKNQGAAKTMAVQLQSLEVRSSDEFEAAFRAAINERADALIVFQSALINTHRTRVVELATQSRLPTMFAERTHVESGGLMSYAPSFFDLHRRAARYVDKILKGAKTAELPIEQPAEFELVINLKTANQIGLTIPPPTF